MRGLQCNKVTKEVTLKQDNSRLADGTNIIIIYKRQISKYSARNSKKHK